MTAKWMQTPQKSYYQTNFRVRGESHAVLNNIALYLFPFNGYIEYLYLIKKDNSYIIFYWIELLRQILNL